MGESADAEKETHTSRWQIAVKVLAGLIAISGGSFALFSYHESDAPTESHSVTMDADVGSADASGSGSASGGVGAASQDFHGEGSQDHSRRVNVFYNEFRLATMRSTDALPESKREHRDRVLDVIHDVLNAADDQQTGPDAPDDLGERLGTIIETAPLSRYQLTSREFTLEPGTAYFLPGGNDAVALVGPRDMNDPNSVYVRRNGRKTPMNVGSVWHFKQEDEECRLVLHEVAENFTSATFSYGCERL